MVNFLLFCLASIGMTNLIVDGSIFTPLRTWLQNKLPANVYELFECHQCTGTWCGFICGLILISYNPFVILLCGCAGGFLASFAYLLVELVLSKTEMTINVPEDPSGN